MTVVEQAIVRTILARHIPDREVRAFGPRISGEAKKASKLKLAIMGNKPLPLRKLAAVEKDFSASVLPFKVEVTDWTAATERLRKSIERGSVVVQSKD